MVERLIFVSCGQKTDKEKQLGRRTQQEIDARAGFKAYFAESVQSLDTPVRSIFDALRRCAGAVVFLPQRGNGSSSMWINQELAILAYRQFFEQREIPILAFKDVAVELEGAISA